MNIQQKPTYSFKIKKSKLLIPKITSLILLITIFYLGILLNISLLKFKADTETSIKSASFLLANVQANGRIERIGKKHVSNIVHIESIAVESKMYDRLRNKQKLQGLLLDLIQQETE